MELAFFPLTAREVVQLSDTDRNKIQLSVLIPLTVGEVIQQTKLCWIVSWVYSLNPLNSRGVIQRGMFWHLMTIRFFLYIRKNPPCLSCLIKDCLATLPRLSAYIAADNMQRGGVHYRTPLLIPLTVGNAIQHYALIITADMGFTQMWAFLSYE
jgi:hypothetical protein